MIYLMIKSIIFTIRSSIIFSSNNPEIYNVNSIIIKSAHYNPKPTLEHIFPKCYMNKISHNDLHNIFKCNNEINNIRSKDKFNDLNFYNGNINNFTKINNTNNYYSNKEKLFIPEIESRGIIARAIMYMSYEYKYKFNKVIDYDVLMNWCINYPPTKEEIYHNNMVYKRQYKRNKFIDLYHKRNYKNYIHNLFSKI